MQAELTDQLGYEKHDPGTKSTDNRKNGTSKKRLRSDQGPMDIEVPRDRDGEFEPIIILKHKREFKSLDAVGLTAAVGPGLRTPASPPTSSRVYTMTTCLSAGTVRKRRSAC
jgi:transposase-like protein